MQSNIKMINEILCHFFILDIWDLACNLYLKHISIQRSNSSIVQQPYVASGYFNGQHRYRQVIANEKTVKVLKEDHLSDSYYQSHIIVAFKKFSGSECHEPKMYLGR